jgi:hypothetical protein
MQDYDTYGELCERDHEQATEALYGALTQILRDTMIREHLEDYDPAALIMSRDAIRLYEQHIKHDRRSLDKYDKALLETL